MAGTKAGGRKAAITNKKKYGHDFYASIGRKGGRNGHTGGFAANPELAKIAGRRGGLTSSRAKHPKAIAMRRNEVDDMLRQEMEAA